MYINGKSYWSDVWNYIYISTLGLTFFVIFEHSAGLPSTTYDELMQVTSVTVILLWFMMFYWLRLFPKMAYFVTMLGETVKDCANFFVMFLICIFMFGNANYILNWSVLGCPYIKPQDSDLTGLSSIFSDYSFPTLQAIG